MLPKPLAEDVTMIELLQILLSPLYVVRSYLPLPLQLHLRTPGLNSSQRSLLAGRAVTTVSIPSCLFVQVDPPHQKGLLRIFFFQDSFRISQAWKKFLSGSLQDLRMPTELFQDLERISESTRNSFRISERKRVFQDFSGLLVLRRIPSWLFEPRRILSRLIPILESLKKIPAPNKVLSGSQDCFRISGSHYFFDACREPIKILWGFLDDGTRIFGSTMNSFRITLPLKNPFRIPF